MASSTSNFWSMGLVKTIRDKSNHLIASDIAIVIKDMFPKAQLHFLVLPKDDIPTIFNLGLQHLNLLDEMQLLAVNIIEVQQRQLTDFKIGFHAEPSMRRLHLHVISKDFVSESLKTKKHWNSFNTKYFRLYEDVYQELNTKGCVEHFDKEELKKLLNEDLLCNQCNFIAGNIPKLKTHLLEHWNERCNRGVGCS